MALVGGDKFARLSSMMNERLQRHWAACEAVALGRGGVSAVSRSTGLSRPMIHRGIREIREQMPQLADERHTSQPVRQVGGGHKPLTEHDPTLAENLKWLLESTTRGDPISPLLWTCKSTRHLAEELAAEGHAVSHRAVDRLLSQMGYSRQANRKTREGSGHPDRNAQKAVTLLTM